MDSKDDLKLVRVGKEIPKGFEVVETGDKIDLSDETIDALALKAIKDGTIQLARKVQCDEERKGESFCGVKTKMKSTSSAPPGGITLKKVGLDHSGRMATVAEVRANFDQMRGPGGLLNQWTIALLDGGKVCGPGHGGIVEEGDFNHQTPPEGNIIGEKIIVIETQSPKAAAGESLCEEEMKETVEGKSTSSAPPGSLGEAMAELAANFEQLDKIHKEGMEELEKLTEEPRKQYEEELKKQGGVAHYKTITKDADGDFKVPSGWSMIPMMQLVNYMGNKDPGDNPELATFLKHIFTSGAGQGFPESKTIITDKKVVMKIDGKEVRKVERSEDRTFKIEEGWVEVPKSDETVQKMVDLVSTRRELELFQTGQLAFITKKDDGEPDYKAIRSDAEGKFDIPDGWSIVGMVDPDMEMLMPRFMTGPQDVDDFNSGKMVIITNKPGAGPKEDWVLVEKKDGEFQAPEGYEIKDVNEANIGDYMDRIQHLLNKTVIEKFNDGLVKFALKAKDEPKKEANLGDFIGAMGGLMAAFAPGEEGQQIQKEVNQMASMFGASPGTQKKDGSKREADLGDVMGAMGGLMAALAPQEKPQKKPKLTKPATVSFIFRPQQEASLVEIAGSFNDWSKTAMAKMDGHWRVYLTMKPGRHQYKYIVDGKWQHDEWLPKTDDTHGGFNNVTNVDYEDADVNSDDIGRSNIKFVEASGGSIPPNAFPAGKDENGETLYVGRAKIQSSLVPGKFQPSRGVVYVPYGGEENFINMSYEVLVQEGKVDNLTWIQASQFQDVIDVIDAREEDALIAFKQELSSEYPLGYTRTASIKCGYEGNGSPLYVARAKIGEQLIIGKMGIEDPMKCWIPLNGEEKEVRGEFEVLCCNELAVVEYNSDKVLSTKKPASAEDEDEEDDSAEAGNNDGNTVQCAQQ